MKTFEPPLLKIYFIYIYSFIYCPTKVLSKQMQSWINSSLGLTLKFFQSSNFQIQIVYTSLNKLQAVSYDIKKSVQIHKILLEACLKFINQFSFDYIFISSSLFIFKIPLLSLRKKKWKLGCSNFQPMTFAIWARKTYLKAQF